MRDTSFLTILQYNIKNDRVGTMIPLLANIYIQDYNIIAIQEPWRSFLVPTTLNSHQSGFHLLYCPRGNIKVCFYVNKSIDPETWKVDFSSPDISTLKITTWTKGVSKVIHIHNVYNPLPFFYSSTKSPSTHPIAKQKLISGAHHILLGNFNLHHSF